MRLLGRELLLGVVPLILIWLVLLLLLLRLLRGRGVICLSERHGGVERWPGLCWRGLILLGGIGIVRGVSVGLVLLAGVGRVLLLLGLILLLVMLILLVLVILPLLLFLQFTRIVRLLTIQYLAIEPHCLGQLVLHLRQHLYS
jgi:hypothetical protein